METLIALARFLLDKMVSVTVSPMSGLAEFFKQELRQVAFLLISSLIAASLLIAGLLIALLEMSAQYDQQGWVALNARLWTGLILLSLSSASLIIALSPRIWRKHPESASAALQEALALLLMEFVREREVSRQSLPQR